MSFLQKQKGSSFSTTNWNLEVLVTLHHHHMSFQQKQKGSSFSTTNWNNEKVIESVKAT